MEPVQEDALVEETLPTAKLIKEGSEEGLPDSLPEV
jgi:hypothetical protein